jgi:hypothetical protein
MQHLQKTGGGSQSIDTARARKTPFARGTDHGTRITSATGRWAGAGKETPVTNAQRLQLPEYVRFIESRVPADSQLILSGERVNQPPHPFALRVPLWRCEVFNFQFHRNLALALSAAAVLAVAGCSNQATNEPTAKRPAAAKPAAVAKAAEPTPATMITLPKGTAISAAARQTLATDKNKVGDTFAASLTAPIQVDGKTVIPKGTQVTCRIVKVKKNEIKVTLASVTIHGKSYPLDSNSIVGPKSQPKTDAKGTDKTKANKDATLLAAKSKLTFKLAKPATIPVKG